MDAKQFDDLSRFLGAAPSRRGLLAALGSGLLVLAAIREVTAAKRSKRKRKNNRKTRRKNEEKLCKNLGESCTPGGKRKCCQELICSTYTASGEIPARCCKQPGQLCTKFDDCCSHFCLKDVTESVGTCLDT